MHKFLFIAVVAITTSLSVAHAQAKSLVLGWEDLIPAPYSGIAMSLPKGSKTLGTPTAATFQVSEEELKEYLGEIEFMKDMQPQGARLADHLHGKTIRIPGYATPVGFNGEDVTQFLLVPFLGACVHVPPPAANQIIYVENAKGLKIDQMWEPIWLTGTLEARPISTVLADVGYTIKVGTVEPYEAYPENVKEAH